MPRVERYTKVTFEPPSSSNAEHLLLSGIEAYIQERLDAVLRSRLVTPGTVEVESEPAPSLQSEALVSPTERQISSHHQRLELPRPGAQSAGPFEPAEAASTIAESIEAYLKDVEPPQREPKTYEEYRNVLHRSIPTRSTK